jgi:hypothetical protein
MYVDVLTPRRHVLGEDRSPGRRMVDPLEETSLFVQRYDGIGSDVLKCREKVIGQIGSWLKDRTIDEKHGRTQVSPPRLGIALEQLIDHPVEVHHSSVLSKIVGRLAEQIVFLPIVAHERDLLRADERAHHVDLVVEFYTAAMRRVYVRSRLEVSERVVREDVLAKRTRFVEKGRWSPLLEQS